MLYDSNLGPRKTGTATRSCRLSDPETHMSSVFARCRTQPRCDAAGADAAAAAAAAAEHRQFDD